MQSSPATRILYLVHDLNDSAVHQRCRMLSDGGACVTLKGFYRGAEPPKTVPGADHILSLGRTYNGGFLHRIYKALCAWIFWARHAVGDGPVDIVIARNLEMLVLAHRARGFFKKPPVLVYEVLDIHRLMLGAGMPARLLRRVEAFFLPVVRMIITSSPAFMTEYFENFYSSLPRVQLVENKIYDPDRHITGTCQQLTPAPPWVIGWFGVLRCRKSLILLRDLVRAYPDRIRVDLRGRPALDQIPDFHDIVAATPGMHYEGPYKHPDDLESIYSAVHFVWAIDLYEEGQNSSWLLPNRIYASGAYRRPSLVQAGVETARFAGARGIGVPLSRPMEDSIKEFFATLTPEKYTHLAQAMVCVRLSDFVAAREDAVEFVAALQEVV